MVTASAVGAVRATNGRGSLAAAIGALLLGFHEPGTDDRRVPRWYDPPVADAREWADDLLVRRGADLMIARSGRSTAPRYTVKAPVTTGGDAGEAAALHHLGEDPLVVEAVHRAPDY